MLISGFGAYAVEVARPGAATSRGVAIGDPLDEAANAYPGLECGVKNEDSEYPTFRYCTGRVAADRDIWFGQDPIRSITMTVCPMSGPDSARCKP